MQKFIEFNIVKFLRESRSWEQKKKSAATGA